MIFLVLKGKGAAATQWVNNKILIDRSNYIFINKLFYIDLDKYDRVINVLKNNVSKSSWPHFQAQIITENDQINMKSVYK